MKSIDPLLMCNRFCPRILCRESEIKAVVLICVICKVTLVSLPLTGLAVAAGAKAAVDVRSTCRAV